MKITRRTLFARLAAAVATLPLFRKSRPVMQEYTVGVNTPHGWEHTSFADTATGFDEIQARLHQRINAEMDRAFHEDADFQKRAEANFDYWIGRHEAARDKISGGA